jgi:4-amino-4-deoxy-L-arabinose transferase-like glycosyltransferase
LLGALLAVALPWHLAAWQAQGSVFIDNYLIRTHLHRFATELDEHVGPWFFYLLVYPGLTAPWILPAAAALIQGDCLRIRRWRNLSKQDPLLLFCAIWIGVTVLLLSLASTKLPHYILSSLPPTAIAAAYFFVPIGHKPIGYRRLSRVLLSTTAVVLLLAAVTLAWMPTLLIPLSQKTPGFSLALRGQLGSVPMVVGLLVWAAISAWAAWRSRQPQLFLGALWAACFLNFLLCQAPPLLQAYRHTVQDPRLAMASQALLQAQPREPIAVIGQAWYSIKLYTQGRAEILNRGKAFGEANNAAAARACSRAGLLMGPKSSVEKTLAHCPSGTQTLLAEDRVAQLSLVRWQPHMPLT